jgi:hypothetical protein
MSAPLNGDCTKDLADQNLGPLIGTLGWIEAAVATKFVVIRFLVQSFVVGRLEWNDWLMLFALVRLDPRSSHVADLSRSWRSSTQA